MEFCPLCALNFSQRVIRDSQVGDQFIVQHTDSVLGDGADAEFTMVGSAEFADRDDIERDGELPSDHRADNDTTSGEPEDDRIPIPVLVEFPG